MAHGLAAAQGARPGGRTASGGGRASRRASHAAVRRSAASGGETSAGTGGVACFDRFGGRGGGAAQGRCSRRSRGPGNTAETGGDPCCPGLAHRSETIGGGSRARGCSSAARGGGPARGERPGPAGAEQDPATGGHRRPRRPRPRYRQPRPRPVAGRPETRPVAMPGPKMPRAEKRKVRPAQWPWASSMVGVAPPKPAVN